MKNIQPTANLGLREKLATQGTKNLADAELLAVFISSGNRKKSCLQLAYELIHQTGDLRGVLNADSQTFLSISGLGMVRYLQLQAAKEICRRSDFIHLQKTTQLNNTQDTHAFIKRQLRDKKNETFAVLFMDSQHRVISYEELFYGTINCASIHPRPIVERALALNAATIIVAHNHPSGLSDASLQDRNVTTKLIKAMELVDVQLLDHLIIGDNEIFSILHGVKWTCH
jgi:DNA repair protein RadC